MCVEHDQRWLAVVDLASSVGVTAEFDAFLYAPLGEENNGMVLSVLSALARLNLDPWEEAARLARMPRDAATQTLTAIITALPNRPSMRPDSATLAASVAALLPRGEAITGEARGTAPAESSGGHFRMTALYVSCYIFFSLVFVGLQWLAEAAESMRPIPTASESTTPADPGADAAQTPRD